MLSLDSDRWNELTHAYGNAGNVAALLRALRPESSSKGTDEPWFSLWSSLAHQGEVYTASFAAVPHVVSVLAASPLKADASFFQFPAWIEVCRTRNAVTIPTDLIDDYFAALA